MAWMQNAWLGVVVTLAGGGGVQVNLEVAFRPKHA